MPSIRAAVCRFLACVKGVKRNRNKCVKMCEDAQGCTIVLMTSTSAAGRQMARTAVNREVARAARRMRLNQYNTPLRQGARLAVSAVNAANGFLSLSFCLVRLLSQSGGCQSCSKVTFVCDNVARSRLVVYHYEDRQPWPRSHNQAATTKQPQPDSHNQTATAKQPRPNSHGQTATAKQPLSKTTIRQPQSDNHSRTTTVR